MPTPPPNPLDSPLFEGCTSRERALIDRLGTVITAPAGRVLIEEGHIGREFVIVLTGQVAVRRHDVEVARIGAGQWVGELALLHPDQRRTATAVAIETSVVLVLGVGEFHRLCREVPIVADRLRSEAETRRGDDPPAR